MSLLRQVVQSWRCECGRHSVPPVQIRIGSGAANEIPDLVRELEVGLRGVIVEDVNTRNVAGATVIKDLTQNGFNVSEVIVEKPDMDNVARVEQNLEPSDFLIGVGGTSVLDIAKLAAHRKRVRYVLLSTGLANSGIVSKTASIYVDGKKESIQVRLADAVIVDLDIVSRAPSWMFGAGFGDLVIEATAIKDWQLGRDEVSEAYCKSIADLEMSTLNQVLDNAEDIRSRSRSGIECLVDALIVSGFGMAMWGSSRPSSGSEHLWSHWLEQYADRNRLPQGRHGEQVAVGTLLMAKYHEIHNPDWWSKETYPRYQAESLMQFLKTVGTPTTLQGISVSRELAVNAFVGAWEYRRDRYTILHKRHPNKSDADEVLDALGL